MNEQEAHFTDSKQAIIEKLKYIFFDAGPLILIDWKCA